MKTKKIKIILFLAVFLSLLAAECFYFLTHNNMNKKVRLPAVDGRFYPAKEAELKNRISGYLAAASISRDGAGIRALLVPHAGYEYSGPVAAYAYKALEGRKVGTVVLLGNSHTSYFQGAAVDGRDSWRTPLGDVEADKKLSGSLIRSTSFLKYDDAVHDSDHILEVQLPFLQTVLKRGFKIVPIVFGDAQPGDYERLAGVLAENLGPDDILVVSSDMSHYPSFADAAEIDQKTLELIEAGDTGALEKYISAVLSSGVAGEETLLCSQGAVETAMRFAAKIGAEAEILERASSGDAPSGDKDRVVGYGAVVWRTGGKREMMAEKLDSEQKKKLLEIARMTVESYVRTGEIPDFEIADDRLKEPEGVFVTLNKKGALRGCIGLIVSLGSPLWENVRDMAVAAATEDGRFDPVTEDELNSLQYEISVLSRPEAIDDWKKIELGKHGVIIAQGRNRGVFLPQVAAETGWSLEEFLAQLCAQKAGLAPTCYKDKDIDIQVFTADVFSEDEIR